MQRNKLTWYVKVLAIILFIAVILAWNFYGRTQSNTIDAATFIPGKIFVNTVASGEIGKFNSDHTITLKWGLDYVAHDKRSNVGVGRWSVQNNILTISSSSLSDGQYDFNSLQKQKVGTSTVVGNWDPVTNSDKYGVFISDSLDNISSLTSVSFFKSFNLK